MIGFMLGTSRAKIMPHPKDNQIPPLQVVFNRLPVTYGNQGALEKNRKRANHRYICGAFKD